MLNKSFRNGLVLGIIVLFIGICIQPAISNEVSIPKISNREKDNIEYKTNEEIHLADKLLNNYFSSLDIKSNDDCGCNDGGDYPKILCKILWWEFFIIYIYCYMRWGMFGTLLDIIEDISIKLNCPPLEPHNYNLLN